VGGKGVIYLDEFEGFARLQYAWCRLRDRLRSFRPQPFASRQPRVEVADAFQDAVSRVAYFSCQYCRPERCGAQNTLHA
jgi:hypothetical protein